jgi:hypothetical protein
MDWSGEWWVLILGPGLIILVVGILYFTRSRAFRFRSSTAQLGFIALQGLNPISDEEKQKFSLFSRGAGGKITNLFGDRIDSPSKLIFDFAANVGSPPSPCNQTVAAFHVSSDGTPDFQMIPVSVSDRISPGAARQAIRFESCPDFAARFQVYGDNEAAIRAFFTSNLVSHLANFNADTDCVIEKAGRWLILYRPNVLIPPDKIFESWQQLQSLAAPILETR